MARDYARIRISIADDPDFQELSFDSQGLYVRVLIPEPTLNYAGVADWRPRRLAPKARDLTVDRIMLAARELEEHRYLLFDLDTEEVLVRSYIRNDELLRNPKMAASVVKAYRETSSKTLRAAIVTELQRLRQDHSEYTSWTHKDTKDSLGRLLSLPNLESVGYANQITVENTNGITNRNGNPNAVPITDGITDRNTNVNHGADHRSEHQSDSVDYLPATAPHTIHHAPEGVSVSTEGHQGSAAEPPAPRCTQHLNDDNPPNCRACGDARRTRERWDTDHRRAHSEAQSERARRSAELRASAVAECDLCDDDGYRGAILCDHDPDGDARTSRGIAAVKAALAGKDA